MRLRGVHQEIACHQKRAAAYWMFFGAGESNIEPVRTCEEVLCFVGTHIWCAVGVYRPCVVVDA